MVLAAGASSRFGSPKQALLLEAVLERVRASSVDEIVVVLGAHDVPSSARTVLCPDWADGPGASLQAGLDALFEEVEAAVVVLADGPDLAPAAVDRVIRPGMGRLTGHVGVRGRRGVAHGTPHRRDLGRGLVRQPS